MNTGEDNRNVPGAGQSESLYSGLGVTPTSKNHIDKGHWATSTSLLLGLLSLWLKILVLFLTSTKCGVNGFEEDCEGLVEPQRRRVGRQGEIPDPWY